MAASRELALAMTARGVTAGAKVQPEQILLWGLRIWRSLGTIRWETGGMSQIEEGGKADLVSSKLRAGDEVVHINEVVLSSSRREAVSLVKGSYKTLRLVVRRDARAAPGPADPGTSDSPSPEHLTSDPQHRKAAWSGGAKLRLKHRRSEPAGRPHSWHSTKIEENQPNASMMQISQGTIGTPWPQSYHSSSSTSDLSGYDHAYLRRSPDRCSSQGSMESLEPSAGYPACHLLSPAKSTSSIDQLGHLHSKRDSAYSSFSTSSSLLEYPPPGAPGSRERSGSVDAPAPGGLLEGMRQADIRYVKTVYDPQRRVSAEYEVNSSALLLQGREAPASSSSADGQGYDRGHHPPPPRGRRGPPPSWSPQGPGSLETVAAADNVTPKAGAPLPPARSDSYAALRHRERPSSWSSLDQKRFCRPQANPAGALKSPFAEEQLQLRPVPERSPESSPPVKPRHHYPPKAQPGQPLLPTGVYPVPSPEPHFAQAPQPSASSNGTLYPALAKEGGYPTPRGACDKAAGLDENGNQSGPSRSAFASCQPPGHESLPLVERTPETPGKCVPGKAHFPLGPDSVRDASPKKHLIQGNSPHPSERRSPQGHTPAPNKLAPTYHHLPSPQAQAWRAAAGDGQRPSRPTELWEGACQEDHNANLQQGPEREGPSQSPSGHLGKTKAAFSSLQNIPDSFRRQSSLEAGGHPKAEGPGRRVAADPRSHPDRPVSCPRPEGKTSALASFPLEEPPSPPGQQQTASLGRRRLSSSGSTSGLAPGLPFGKPHCSVLEKVSKIEQREQGRPRPPSVGSPAANGHTYRPARAAPASRSDSEDAHANAHVSGPTGPTEPPGSGEPRFRHGDPKPEDVSWQPYGALKRGASAEGSRGSPLQGSEPPRRGDAHLLRSQSTFQLLGEAEEDARWQRDRRPGTPEESPAPDVPFSRAYRNSIKDAQCRVLGATSFRRRDLEPGTAGAAAAGAVGAVGASRPWRPRPASAHVGLRSPEAPPSASPHTPRERHSVTPAKADPPAPPVARRGPRRRLDPEQKKRSYSEPEKMNEVGVSSEEAERAPLGAPRALAAAAAAGALRFPESTVADRRRLFERDGKACSTLSLSGPELKQFQQSALADYVQRKTGKRPGPAAAAAAGGLQEPGLQERAHGSYLQPGLSAAASLCSLREPGLCSPREPGLCAPREPGLCAPREPGPQPRREAALLLEPPRGARDRSSSFAAGGRLLLGERRRGDPAQRELPGGASGAGPKGTPKPDRTPGEPSPWGAAAGRAGKSMSAEDLLERSDFLAVPVHVRSRSSPTTHKKLQDVLLGEDSGSGLVKEPCYLAGPGPRPRGCPERGEEETLALQHQPSPRWGGSGCRAPGASAPGDCPGQPDPQRQAGRTPGPRPLPTGLQGHHLTDTRAGPPTPLSSALPSPAPSSYSPQAASDQPAGRDAGPAGQQPLPPCAPAGTPRSSGPGLAQPPGCPRGQEPHSPERGAEEGKRRQPPLPRVTWAHTVRENSLPKDPCSPESAGLKHRPKPQSLPIPSSSSTSDPDTPLGVPSTPARISLWISESALQASPQPREDYDYDEVFVRDLLPTFEALPPPPPPPPPPSQEIPGNSWDDFPPPPPPALCEAQPDEGKGGMELPASSSSRSANGTVAKERPVPGAAPPVGHQTPVSRPQTSVRGSQAHGPSPPPTPGARPQHAGPLGWQPGPGKQPPAPTQGLVHDPLSGTQEDSAGPGPQKTSEDIRTEVLAKEIVHQDKSLADILDPDSRLKTTMDLMEGLFPRDGNLLQENGVKKKAVQRAVSCSGHEGKRSDDKEAVGMLVHCPAYYSVSAPKAELLNKIKHMPEEMSEEEEQVDVNEKKAELIGSLTHKLETLQEAKRSLLMDIKLNNALGEEVEALISELCKPNEFDKYKMFIGDLDKVVSLLLSLSGRLARVENVLSGLGEDASKEERSSLAEKRKVLAGQHEDARELKENLDRRERVVLDILASYLSEEQLQDYQHFVKMKSTLLIEQRKLDDKIKLGQEQVRCLLESLPPDFVPKAGALTLPPDLTSQTTPPPPGGCAPGGVCPPVTSPL